MKRTARAFKSSLKFFSVIREYRKLKQSHMYHPKSDMPALVLTLMHSLGIRRCVLHEKIVSVGTDVGSLVLIAGARSVGPSAHESNAKLKMMSTSDIV